MISRTRNGWTFYIHLLLWRISTYQGDLCHVLCLLCKSSLGKEQQKSFPLCKFFSWRGSSHQVSKLRQRHFIKINNPSGNLGPVNWVSKLRRCDFILNGAFEMKSRRRSLLKHCQITNPPSNLGPVNRISNLQAFDFIVCSAHHLWAISTTDVLNI